MPPRLLAFSLVSCTLAFASLLAGCAKPPVPVAEAPEQLPPHMGDAPPAALCTVTPFHVADGGTTAINMLVSNDGGFCAASLTAGSGQPFDAPLVRDKPLHGDETVVRYNRKTSVEYIAKRGYVGHDAFTVRLILKGQAGYTTLNVGVDVQAVVAAAKTS